MDPLVANLRTAMPEMPYVADAVNTLVSLISAMTYWANAT